MKAARKKPELRTVTFVDGPADGKQFQFPASVAPVDVADEIEAYTGARYLVCGDVAAFVSLVPGAA